MYSLCALLGNGAHLKGRLGGVGSCRVIDLSGVLGMVPLSEPLLREIHHGWRDGAARSAAIQGFEFLTPPVERWVRAVSSGSPVAYVETEYYGGEGFERSAVFRDAEVILGPLDGAGAVNQALRALGVQPKPGEEEFVAAGLGRYRSVEEWLSE